VSAFCQAAQKIFFYPKVGPRGNTPAQLFSFWPDQFPAAGHAARPAQPQVELTEDQFEIILLGAFVQSVHNNCGLVGHSLLLGRRKLLAQIDYKRDFVP
jgi:hypothetical protein